MSTASTEITAEDKDLFRREVLSQLDEVNCCFAAISNLLSPEPTFEGEHRDNLSLLLQRLNGEQSNLFEQLRHPELYQ